MGTNGSLCSRQRPERAWFDGTPSGFVLAAKDGRFVTELQHLRDVETAPPNFDVSGTLASNVLG
jgi:hypothetical protein